MIFLLACQFPSRAVVFFRFTQYNVDEGLTQSSVYSIAQDTRGYIWCGTGEGLNRLRGNSIENFYWQQKGPFQLLDNSIRHIHSTSDGTIYFGSDMGFTSYVLGDSNFLKTNLFKVNNFHDFRPILSSDKYVWITKNRRAIGRFNRQDGSELEIKFPKGNWMPKPRTTSNRAIWLNESGDSLLIFDKRIGSFRTKQLPESVDNFAPDRHGEIVFQSANAFLRLDPASNSFEEMFQIDETPEKEYFLIDQQGRIWIQREDGKIAAYDSTGALQFCSAPEALRVRQLYTMYEDNAGNVWIGTDGAGLLKIAVSELHFHTLIRAKTDEPLNGFVRQVRTDAAGNSYTAFIADPKIYKHDRYGKLLDIIPLQIPGAEEITGLYPLNDDELLIGTRKGLFHMDPSGDFSRISDLPGTHRFERSEDQLWIAGSSGLLRLNPIDRPIIIDQALGVNQFSIRSLAVVNTDHLICGLHSGGLLAIKHTKSGMIPGYSEIKVNDIKRVSDSHWVLATNTGIHLTDQRFRLIRKFDRSNGLIDFFIYGILVQDSETIWASSNKGLIRLNISSGEVTNFNRTSGLSSPEFNSGAFYAGENGNFYFGGIEGVNFFKPGAVPNRDPFYPIFLRSFSSADRNLHPDRYDAIQLQWNENSINAELDVLDYLGTESAVLWVKLEGIEGADWELLGKKRVYRAGKLKSGEYTFRVRQQRGADFKEHVLARFTIATPWWRRWWFILCSGALSALLVVGISVYLTRRRHLARIRELEREQRLQEIRKGIYRDLHDEIGSGLTRISMLSEIAAGETRNTDVLPTLQRTAVEITRKLRDIVWGMKSENEQVIEVALRIQQIGIEATETAGIDFQFEKSLETENTILNPELIRNLILVCREAINNTIKHARASYIQVVITQRRSQITLTIEDDGLGILESDLDPSRQNGISIMRERINQLKGEFRLESEPGEGTMIWVQIPL
ncbi:MAG: hypothetical protein H6606_06165 [Flavobacteriales bacterium]|nr:hypothetical protein [Flavobacteriales bacterium]